MPYAKLKDANPSILGIKPPVTLAQANAIAKHADGLAAHKNSIKSPWGTAISSFKKSHIVKDGKSWVKREAKEFAEAATIKKRAQRLMKDAEALLATKKLPAAVRKEIRDLRNALRKTWADLSDESDNEWEAKSGELDMEIMEAMKIDIDGKKVPFVDMVETWKAKVGEVEEKEGEPVAEYYPDEEVAYVPYGTVTSFAALKTANETKEAITGTRILTTQFQSLVGNIMYNNDIPNGEKLGAIQDLTSEFIELVTEQMEDIGEAATAGEAAHEQESDSEDGLVKLAESMGSIIGLVENETLQENDSRAPLLLDLQIIQPGPGNGKDKRWYPADMLKRDAHIFEGVDIFVTDHTEHGEKTKVGKIKEITGFTPEGGPIGRAIIFDPDTAEKTRNRAVAEELETLHCSILASGMVSDGKIDGQDYSIVESITSARSVDLVGRAGAGGRVLNIAEAEKEATMPSKEKAEEKEELEEVVDVILAEGKEQPDQKPEPEQEPEQEILNEADVQEALDSTNLPDEAKAWLAEAQYSDKGALATAVKKATARVKAMTGSGEVTGMGESDPPEAPKPLTEEEKLADFNRVAVECGFAEV